MCARTARKQGPLDERECSEPSGAAVSSLTRCQLSLTHGDERLVVALHDILVKLLLPFF